MRHLLIIPLVCTFLCACGPQLVILHTNDTHSHLDPLRDGHGGAIERAAFVDSVRAEYGESRVLLLHAGDWNQGSSYYSELGGELEVKMVNAFRYDVVTLGNHELDNGLDHLAARVKKLQVPVVCANLDFSGNALADCVLPYTIVRKAGKKIGIIGLEADISTCVQSKVSSQIRQLDPVGETLKWAGYLKNTERCDLVILLSHQGYEEDIANAARLRGVDLVIGGHTHTFVKDFTYVEDLDGKQVPIVTDGCWGLEMGEIKIYRK